MGDFFDVPFDDGTLIKLQIFKGYLREWLPVFLSKRSFVNNVRIYDFFAGQGKDIEGKSGSPLIIRDELENYILRIRPDNLNIKIFLNEKSRKGNDLLRQNFGKPTFCDFEIERMDFHSAFDK